MFVIVLVEFGVESVVVFFGLLVNGLVNVLNLVLMFVMLKFFDECEDFLFFVNVIVGKLMYKFSYIFDGFIGIFLLLLVSGFGVMGGFKL